MYRSRFGCGWGRGCYPYYGGYWGYPYAWSYPYYGGLGYSPLLASAIYGTYGYPYGV